MAIGIAQIPANKDLFRICDWISLPRSQTYLDIAALAASVAREGPCLCYTEGMSCASLFARRVPLIARPLVRTRVSRATSVWQGTLKEGSGSVSVGSGTIKELEYSFASRFETDETKCNPEELIGSAISGCYSMFLAALLTKKGLNPDAVTTTATVTLAEGPLISSIKLATEGKCSGVDAKTFEELALEAKEGCPVSKALAAVPEVTLEAKLL
ncbi:unnamed protein product [Amoebophrya sp. A120]|nr:unnamed protein product [Amoebophrya sp. A120]|eukprot:GSA120T00017522001.1